jgi:hypothetical protein
VPSGTAVRRSRGYDYAHYPVRRFADARAIDQASPRGLVLPR